MKKSTHKRLTAWLLTLALVVTLLPGMGMTALAVEDGDEGNGPPAVEVVEPEDESSGSDETVGTPPQPEPEPPALPESKEEEKTTEDEGDPSGSDYDIEADTQPRGLMRALAAPTAAGELQVTGAYVGHDAESAQSNWVASSILSGSITAIDPGSFYVEEQVYIKLVANSDHVKWAVTIGTLGSDATLDDTGLTLDENTGVISGTIAATRNGYLTLSAEDTQTGASLSFWLFTDFYSDSQKPVITTDSLPNGTAEQQYSQRLEFTGYHSGWVEWTVVSGNLPDGLTVGYYSGGGGSLIRGTPTTPGNYTFTLKLRTVAGTTQKEFTLVINDALIAPVFKEPNSTIVLPYAVIGKTYSYDMHKFLANESTCSRPLRWYGASNLPKGLSFNETTGVLSVAPTDSTPTTIHNFTVQVLNDAGNASQRFEIQVYRQPDITSPETELNLTAGVYFEWKPTYTGSGNWSATELPAGLKFSEGNGSIYGTPTVPGTYNVTLKLTANSELYAEKPLKLVVAENNGINISQTSEHTFYGQQSGYAASALIAKEVTVTNTGYSALPLTYELTGIDADSFVLSKSSETLAPGASTTFTVKPKVGLPERTHKATVEVRSGSLVSAFNVSFTVSQNAVGPTVITRDKLPYAVVGKPWSYQLQASGTGPITWAKDWENTNPWPAWLQLDSTTGVISGTPTESKLQVTLYVKASNSGGSDTESFYFQVYDKPTITLKVQNSSEEWVPHTSNTLPDAYTTQRGGYLQFYTGAGGGDTFTTIEGVMPSGMDFVDSDTWGQFIINNALSTGTYSFTLVSRNYVDSEKTQFIGEDRKTVTMTVYSTPQYNGAPAFSIGEMTVGTAITPIDFSKMFSGGKAPLTYTLDGDLPKGLTLDSSGILSGTPLIAGTGSVFRIFCTDANGKAANPVIYYGYRYLPQVALGTPSGASFLNSDGLDLKLDYPTLDGNVKLYYTTDGKDPKDSSTKIEADPGATVKIGANIGAGNSVTVRVRAYQSTAEDDYQWSDETKATYVSVKRPNAPTANWENGTTFTTPLGVMLSCDTAGATIYYKLNGSTTYTIYTGKPIVLTKTTTLEVRSSLNNILSESVTYTYTKVAGVSVSGTAVSWNDKDNAEYYLYPTTMSDADIRAQWKKGGAVTGYTYTGTGGTISDVTVDGKAMKSQSFSFSTVPAGDYKLVIFKAEKYVPKIVPITVDSTDHDCGQLKLWLYGDVNYDGKVKAGDATQILKYTSYKRTFSEEEMLAADVNNDGKIKAGDATQILKYTSYKASAFDNIP